MKYTKENIKIEQGFLLFWGHQPTKDGSNSKTCFSQWWLSAFTSDGLVYKTAEHYMMAKKAELFGDIEAIQGILASKSPAEAKKLGRLVRDFNEQLWLANRYRIVKEANLLKFSQNDELKDFLLSTDDRIIVEASPVDNIWGIGLAADHPNAEIPENWEGLNLLGFALMEVRDELREG